VTDRKSDRYRFPLSIIRHAFRLYHQFPLSERDVQELLQQRGLIISIVVNGLSFEITWVWKQTAMARSSGFVVPLCTTRPYLPSPMRSDEPGPGAALLERLRLFDGTHLKRASALLFHPDPEAFIGGAWIKLGAYGPVPAPRFDVTAPQRVARLSEPFTDQAWDQGVLNRHYRFRAAQPLLAATLTLREQSYIVGQITLSETAAEEVVALTLGRDPDVTYRRSLEVLDEDEPDEPLEVTRTAYRIIHTVRNAKVRLVGIEIEERLAGEEVCSAEGDGLLHDGNLQFEQALGPGEDLDGPTGAGDQS